MGRSTCASVAEDDLHPISMDFPFGPYLKSGKSQNGSTKLGYGWFSRINHVLILSISERASSRNLDAIFYFGSELFVMFGIGEILVGLVFSKSPLTFSLWSRENGNWDGDVDFWNQMEIWFSKVVDLTTAPPSNLCVSSRRAFGSLSGIPVYNQ